VAPETPPVAYPPPDPFTARPESLLPVPLPDPVALPEGPVNQPEPPAVPGPPPEPEPPLPVPPPVPLRLSLLPSAATINCRSFSGSFKSLSVCSEFIPNVRAASCAATVDFATAESAGTKQTSLTCTCGSPSSAAFSWSASCVGFVVELVGNPRTKRARLACVTLGEKWMLAMPAVESMRAKLFSAAAESSGVPSSSRRSPEAASNKPVWSSGPMAARNSLQAVSYCLAVRGCPKSYIRANFNRMFRLRTKARAAAARALLSWAVGAIVARRRNRSLKIMAFRPTFSNGTRVLFGTDLWFYLLVGVTLLPTGGKSPRLSHRSSWRTSPKTPAAPSLRNISRRVAIDWRL
jgi:hypothetical protein